MKTEDEDNRPVIMTSVVSVRAVAASVSAPGLAASGSVLVSTCVYLCVVGTTLVSGHSRVCHTTACFTH